jgi:hypothetical protein
MRQEKENQGPQHTRSGREVRGTNPGVPPPLAKYWEGPNDKRRQGDVDDDAAAAAATLTDLGGSQVPQCKRKRPTVSNDETEANSDSSGSADGQGYSEHSDDE